MKNLKRQNNIRYITAISCLTLFVLFAPLFSYAVSPECYGVEDISDDAARDEANTTSNPISTTCFGAIACTYCDALPNDNSSGTTWDNPVIRFAFQSVATQRVEIAMGECATVKGVRFCARTALAGEYGNDSEKPRLCLYEDPMDGMDTNPNENGYHENAENEDALDIGEAALLGTLAGVASSGFLGGLAAPIGALVGIITAAITQTHNHMVVKTIGCVDRPLAVGPPVWSNDAWNKSYLPAPVIVYGDSSTFFNPSIELHFCTSTTSGGETINAMCDYDENSQLREDQELLSTKVLVPSYANGFVDTVNSAVDGEDLREFEARITSTAPQKICIYQIKNRYGKDAEIPQGCVDRPGYMPLPVIANITSSIEGVSSLKVSFSGDESNSISIKNGECDILHKITFCAEEVIEENALCLEGYSTAPTVAVTNYPSEDNEDSDNNGDVIKGLPNSLYGIGESIKNTSANLEKVNQTLMISTVNLNIAAWAYTPPDGRPSSISDDYFVNGSATPAQYLRSMTAMELGLCVSNDPDILNADWTAYDTPGSYTYTPDNNCVELEVQAWGAGASGTNDTGTGNDSGGGAGGYVNATVQVDDASEYKITVGKGGVPTYVNYYKHIRGNGTWSSFADSADNILVRAFGGTSKNGKGSECVSPAVCNEQENGQNAQENSCAIIAYDYTTNGLSEGGAVWNPDDNTMYYPGTKQCDGSKDYDSSLHKTEITDLTQLNAESNLIFPSFPGVGGCAADHCDLFSPYRGNVGPGGHGLVRIRCSAMENTDKTPKPGDSQEYKP
jgi:hypothetical protein